MYLCVLSIANLLCPASSACCLCVCGLLFVAELQGCEWVDFLAPVSLSSSTPCTNHLGRSETFRLFFFASQGLKCGVLLPSRRGMLQRNGLWRISKPMGHCDLPNQGNTSLHGAPTHGHSVCMALIEVTDCGPLQEQNLLTVLKFFKLSRDSLMDFCVLCSYTDIRVRACR